MTLLPLPRQPLATVVGRPIFVDKKVEKPTQAEIDELHERYLKALRELWDEYKDVFYADRVKEMDFAC